MIRNVFRATTRIPDAVRVVTIGVIAALWPGRDEPDISDWLDAQSPARQTGLQALVIFVLAIMAILFAQFGWIGLGLYFGIVLWLIR
ncbi:hypothetical protein JQU17_04480 [Ponticoccus sp. SC2-23]|uniref:hypothetical protein n=1 Tax=Alexandriicola marinus TaxID=2081710 RepID=UPI000FDBFAC1|nr:hypothetical protein [Alexandriicola marinus]MBM1219443.1 hypothetical protein [Ponticoccus sp. SC6-9]MBM1223485.1 hypothetical protein [Ponticoccus sp. SC6-15]MBM1229256.1 hypothetical protein [Ponticoccus sp. SC6-38]MBM1232451.1 hypothetical protein [Ponticoccus sp. SC6-45]MBM1237599.1 hypothetical protein [Ponticoccus sp. SC6-49]MBM1241462.1 hypothetical protein [Ponticoccus sp. SC2-64]MBM1245975.1 hypothetical protein [Ponticoccus sp. SC6-42]MBM1250453.1 hypothetical protein [Pontico